MATVDGYINSFESEKREWLTTLVAIMRENFPEIDETIRSISPSTRWTSR